MARGLLDDYRQMATSTGRLKNRRRSGGQKEQGLLGGGIVDAEAALIDAYNRFELPDDALGLLSLPAKAAVGLGRMALTDISNLTQSIMQTDRSDPDAMAQAATDGLKLMSATNMAGGLLSRMTGTPTGAVLGANVYQGGPHKYGPEGAADSLQHMSKGEGAQAYGWGRYDAESKGVADDYRKNLSGGGRVLNVDGVENPSELLKSAMTTQGSPEEYIKQARLGLAHVKKRMDNANKKDEGLGFSEHDMERMEYDKRLKDIQELETYVGKDISFGDAGHIYKHDLPDSDIARYLDWDAPLSEQPEIAKALDAMLPLSAADKKQMTTRIIKLQDRLNRRKDYDPYVKNTGDVEANDRIKEEIQQLKATILDGSLTGRELHNQVVKELGSSQAVSETLAKAGIPGLKYFDGMSRYHPNSLPDNRITNEARKWLDSADGDTDKALRSFYDSSPRNEFAGVEMDEVVKVIKQAGRKQTRNFVTWDQDVLNRMKLLERNGEKFDGLLSR